MNEISLELKFSKDLVAFVARQFNVTYNCSPLQACSVPDCVSPFTKNVADAVKRILCSIHGKVEEDCGDWQPETMEHKFKHYVNLKTFIVRNRKFDLEEFLEYCTVLSLMGTILYSRGCHSALGIIVPRIAFTLEYKRRQKEIDSNIWSTLAYVY